MANAPMASRYDLATLSADYDADGVVAIPNLLDKDWVSRLLNVVDEVRERSNRNEEFPHIECFRAPGRMTVRWMWREYGVVQSFFSDAGVAEVVAAILKTPDLQYWFDLTFIHDHGEDSVGTPWHHDIAAFPFSGTKIPSLWIALTDMDLDQAPLRCIRGSHRNPTMFRPPVYVDDTLPVPEGYAEMPDVDAMVAGGEAEVLEWAVKAGDALIIHPFTIHGAPPVKRAGERRIAFTTRWAGDDVQWCPNAFSMPIAGIDYSQVPAGQRPEGALFPYVIGGPAA
jgi:ectoine hydroxylase-related dioxygenase (phytanoyl-CoA dioxygenase family)